MADGRLPVEAPAGPPGSDLRPAQRLAVDAPGGVAVVAGAGTGKTHMLAHRFLKHVRDGLDPLEIVAVTFTERAAAELRSRIRDLLHTSLPAGSQASLTVEAAQISTMHALALRVCREFPEQAGVAPDFGLLDDLEGGVWLTERIESALSTVPRALLDSIPYQSLRGALSELLRDPVTADAAFSHGPEEWPALVAAARAAALDELTAAPAWREAAAVASATTGAEGDRRETTRRECVVGLAALAAGDIDDGLRTIAALSLVGGSRKAFAEGDFAALGDAIRYLRDAVRLARTAGQVDLALGEVDARLAELLPLLHAAYLSIREHLESEKRARRVLDFADLEVHALRALADPLVVAHYGSRWRALLVDEFQDTNAVQERLLDALAGSMTVTVVGDEKQSIYGFRGAKSEVFERYRRRVVASGGAEVVLAESFRTHGGLLEDLNRTFAPLLAGQHQALTALRSVKPGVGPFTTLTVVSGGGTKAGRQLSEARALATAIKALVDEGAAVHDKGTGEVRPVRFSDVAVLARGWQALGVYGEVLPALGVPAVHTGGGNLLAMREATDGITLLRALAGPDDDVAMVALLRSPFFAVDDVTLYRLARHRAANREAPEGAEPLGYWQTLTALPDPEPGLARARDVIADLLARRHSLAPSALLLAADSLTGHSAVLAGLPGGRRRLADYGGFVDLIRRLEVGSEDLFTVWRRLRLLLAAGVEVGRPRLAAEGAVTLLTIHSSKGLEWPVVAVADLERRSPTRRPPLALDPDVGVALRLEGDDGEAEEPAVYRVLRARAAAREEQETRRLLYVALTRARDHLILSAAAERGGALDVLDPGLRAAGVARLVVTHDPPSATYPAQARPVGSGTTSMVDEHALRAVAPLDLGSGDGTGGQEPGGASDVDTTPAGWWGVMDLVATLDDAWSPVAQALAAAGVRPPATDLAGRWLKRAARDHEAADEPADRAPTYLLMAWRVSGGVLALVSAAAGAGLEPETGVEEAGARRPGGVVPAGELSIAKRPRGGAAGDETARVWLLPLDPLASPAVAVERVVAALSAGDDKAAG